MIQPYIRVEGVRGEGQNAVGCGDVEAQVNVQDGLASAEVLASASWQARQWLGLPSPTEGATADFVVCDTDPRRDLKALKHPRRIVLNSRIIR
jgi:imidazolonepropionase-like amidohydrolase